MSAKDRIVDLQKQLKIARDALSKIMCGCRDPDFVASRALDEIWGLDAKQPLQHLVGHERKATP